jgi:hypothetical protein
VEKPRYAQNCHRLTLAGSEEYCNTAPVSKRNEEERQSVVGTGSSKSGGNEKERKGEDDAPESHYGTPSSNELPQQRLTCPPSRLTQTCLC